MSKLLFAALFVGVSLFTVYFLTAPRQVPPRKTKGLMVPSVFLHAVSFAHPVVEELKPKSTEPKDEVSDHEATSAEKKEASEESTVAVSELEVTQSPLLLQQQQAQGQNMSASMLGGSVIFVENANSMSSSVMDASFVDLGAFGIFLSGVS